MQDVIIIGCGVIGAACAYELSKYRLSVTVLEASNDVANGATKANSAIIHAGYDPLPDTNMARLNVNGNFLMEMLCRRLNVPFRRIGSHVLAFDAADMETLRKLYDRGVRNGVPGLRLLNAAEVHLMEPGIDDNVTGSLYAPTTGIISPWELCIALAETAVCNGVHLKLNARVTDIQRENGGYRVITANGVYSCRYLLNAAGIYSDQIHDMVSAPYFRIQPSRGEYFLLDKSECSRTNSVLFQCPNSLGKGVLVSPTIHGNLIVGPNAENLFQPDTSTTEAGLAFVRTVAQKSVPQINFRENIRNFAGIRANHSSDDFLIGEYADAPGFYDLAGIKSPGLSSSPAIALEMIEWMREKMPLVEKETHRLAPRPVPFAALSDDEKNALIARDPRYAHVICRCETVTEGEIIAAIRGPIPAVTVNAVKRRVSAGMGRCQGGFCGPRVLEILCRELHCDPEQIMLEEPGSPMINQKDTEENRT